LIFVKEKYYGYVAFFATNIVNSDSVFDNSDKINSGSHIFIGFMSALSPVPPSCRGGSSYGYGDKNQEKGSSRSSVLMERVIAIPLIHRHAHRRLNSGQQFNVALL